MLGVFNMRLVTVGAALVVLSCVVAACSGKPEGAVANIAKTPIAGLGNDSGTTISGLEDAAAPASEDAGAEDANAAPEDAPSALEDGGAPGAHDSGSAGHDAGHDAGDSADSGGGDEKDAAADAADAASSLPPGVDACESLGGTTTIDNAEACSIPACGGSWNTVETGTQLFLVCPVTDAGVATPTQAGCTGGTVTFCTFTYAADQVRSYATYCCPN